MKITKRGGRAEVDFSGTSRQARTCINATALDAKTTVGVAFKYLFDPRTLLVHVNYCDDEELAILAAGQTSVVYCPRTHRYFGHAPHRWREMLGHGIVTTPRGLFGCLSTPMTEAELEAFVEALDRSLTALGYV